MSKLRDDEYRTQKKSKPYRDPDEAVVIRKLNRHLLPPLALITLLNYIDRSNLAFAALQLNQRYAGLAYWSHKTFRTLASDTLHIAFDNDTP